MRGVKEIDLLKIDQVIGPTECLPIDPGMVIEQAHPFGEGKLPEDVIVGPACLFGQTADIGGQPARPPAFGLCGPLAFPLSPCTEVRALFMASISLSTRGVASW